MRDDLTTATAATVTSAPTLSLAQAPTRVQTLAETPAASSSPFGRWARHWPPRSDRAQRQTVLAAAATAYPAARPATPTPGSSSPASPRLAQVSPAALAGQPLPAVRQQLQHEGLHVRVAWQPNGRQQPGTVLTVQPAGQLPAGTTVRVTAALPRPDTTTATANGDGQGDQSGD